VRGYILSDLGRPLLPVVDDTTGATAYYEVVTAANVITGELKRKNDREGEYVEGRPFLYYSYKVMEIATGRRRQAGREYLQRVDREVH
jgi:hypothetical protein